MFQARRLSKALKDCQLSFHILGNSWKFISYGMASINFCWQWAEGIREQEAAGRETILTHESIQKPMRGSSRRSTLELPHDSVVPPLGRCLKDAILLWGMFQKNWKQIFKKILVRECSLLHCLQNNQTGKASWMSINRWMNKQNVV